MLFDEKIGVRAAIGSGLCLVIVLSPLLAGAAVFASCHRFATCQRKSGVGVGAKRSLADLLEGGV